MATMTWLFGIGVALLTASSLALPARSAQPRPSRRRTAWIKGLAALRAAVSTVLASIAFVAVHDAVAAGSDAVRWTLTLAAGGCLLVVILNACAGLWLLSPFVGADLGLEVIASSTRGTIVGYGWARLEVTTPTGWTAHVPYASLALRPFVVCRQDGPRVVELVLRREHWHDAELQYLRQLAVLSPYRDPSVPVRVSRRARVATVRFGLAQRATRESALRHLERGLSSSESSLRQRGAGRAQAPHGLHPQLERP
jgi:hypothetical protein